MGKITETRQLYKEVINELSQSAENWRKFLDSSSWNFKYDFDDQILIYAQRPVPIAIGIDFFIQRIYNISLYSLNLLSLFYQLSS